MKKHIRARVLLLHLLFFCFLTGLAAQQSQENSDAVKIFLDCSRCDLDFIRQNLSLVNYVRDVREAEVYILVSRQRTGSDGLQYTFFFNGALQYKGKTDTLLMHTAPDDTDDNIRQAHLKLLEAGLMPYIAKTTQFNNVEINFKNAPDQAFARPFDPWNNWVMELSIRGYLSGDDNYRETNLNNDFSIQRVTEASKVNFSFEFDYDVELFKFDEESDVKNIQRFYGFEQIYVKSLGEHWSIGQAVNVYSSVYSNTSLSILAVPAVEYNIFPYSESASRQLRILYFVGPVYKNYIETTVYGKDEEWLVNQNLEVSYEAQAKWGSVYSSLSGTNYLHDFNLFRLSWYNSFRIRVFKGLSFRMGGGFQFIRNQINLVQGDASKDEILLRQRELQRNFSYRANFGVSYTFGSIYNNIVNPRFGRYF